MKSIIKILLILIFSILLTACGGYLPSASSNWSQNPEEMHVWDPPDEETLAKRRAYQRHLDNLTGEIERLFLNHSALIQQELAMNDNTNRIDPKIREMEKDFGNRIDKEHKRNKKMEEDLNDARAKYEQENKRFQKLTEVKPPVIFSSTDYNSAINGFKDGKYEFSLKLFNKLLKQNPPKFLEDNIHFGIGASYFRLKKYPQAKKHFQKILDEFQMGDKRFISYVMLGAIHNVQGEKSRALFLLEQALNNNPPPKIKAMITRLLSEIGEEPNYATN